MEIDTNTKKSFFERKTVRVNDFNRETRKKLIH